MDRVRRRGLELEPFFEACTAEGVQAIEESKRLVEELCTYLDRGWSALVLVQADEDIGQESTPSRSHKSVYEVP